MGLPHVVVPAESPGDGERVARDDLLTGERFLVAVGGDRTVHEVANGMLQDGRPLHPEAVLGVIAAGAQSDFIKTFGLPSDVERACDHLLGDHVFPIDAGTVVATSGRASVKRSFVNIAEVGLGASIARRTAGLPEGLGRARRFLGFWLGLALFRPAHVRLGGDLDVLVMKGPKSDAFTMLPKTYLGEHLPHPNIVEYRSRTLRVEASPALWVHADGEMVGSTPAAFEVVPKAIRLKI